MSQNIQNMLDAKFIEKADLMEEQLVKVIKDQEKQELMILILEKRI
jgi:hypothetical protein